MNGGTIMKNVLLTCFSVLLCLSLSAFGKSGIIYRNPRVYNVDYKFELCPDPNKIDRDKDLKLWIPVPREWASQKAVKIISVAPKPHAEYTDPEHGNRMLFWDFGKTPEKTTYEINLRYRLESYEIYAEIDPNNVRTYDKTSEEYQLYTRSTHTVRITPKIREMAREAIGGETNPYLQAKCIFDFVRKKMRYKILDHKRGRGIECLLEYPVVDEDTGEEYYEGCCSQYSAFFCALCRAVGIPARSVFAFRGGRPWRPEQEELKPRYKFEAELSVDGLAAVQHFGDMWPHVWAEFLVPEYGWVFADAQTGRFGHQDNAKIILNKGRDVQLGPGSPPTKSEGYGSQYVPLHANRADYLFSAVWDIRDIHAAKLYVLHHADPFPAYGMTNYDPADSAGYRAMTLKRLNEVRSDSDRSMVKKLREDRRLQYELEPFVCHMLRQVVGEPCFLDIRDAYVDERVQSSKPVSTDRFTEIVEKIHGKTLAWFWDQWLPLDSLPQLKLYNVQTMKENGRWRVQGTLSQVSETTFRLPVELALRMDTRTERKTLQLNNRNATFEFYTSYKPKQIIVDPDNNILKIQKMPPLLRQIWRSYRNLTIVYGTTERKEANKAAAQHFSSEYLRDTAVIADVDANDSDLDKQCLVLFGRPQSGTAAAQFMDVFPVRFNDNTFVYQGQTYEVPKDSIAQIIEHPKDPNRIVVLYAGLSDATNQKLSAKSYFSWEAASYAIFNKDQELTRGLWLADKDLFWAFEQ